MVEAKLDYLPYANLALQQYAANILRTVTIENKSEEELDGLEIRLTTTPQLTLPASIPLRKIAPHEKLILDDVSLALDYNAISCLQEAITSNLLLEVCKGEEVLFSSDNQLTGFAVDQWLGSNIMPELLAAFVLPNMSVVEAFLSDVSTELKVATGSPNIAAYQQGREHAYAIFSAVFRAIQSKGFTYSVDLPSNGHEGQRIRLPDHIMKFGQANCLESTLLYASILELCGLHPVIMLNKTHAYIGCHLKDYFFQDLPLDDLQTIRKLIEMDEFAICETTLTSGDTTFSVAEESAKKEQLHNTQVFLYAIDVIRARNSGVFPLPIRQSVDGVVIDVKPREARNTVSEPQRELQAGIDLSSLSNDTPGGRIERWKQKLLDLSLRNPLLNLRENASFIPIACSNVYELENKLAANKKFLLKPVEELVSAKDQLELIKAGDYSAIHPVLEKELEQGRLWSTLTPTEMKRKLTAIFRQARTDQEEGGVNTLFLSLGFLEWTASEKDTKHYMAPLLLMPVTLSRKPVIQEFSIARLDEETMINSTLLEMLQRDFNIAIPGLNPLPTDDSGLDVAKIFSIIREAIKNIKGWEVHCLSRLAIFSFSKFILWNDLTNHAEQLKQHKLINHLVKGGGNFDDGIDVFAPEDIGKQLELNSLFCPMSADSSQLTAVKYSELGKSFVLHGPPGTGKSQTITNIIAHNLALGRRVLFVSEKKAALDVVHNRLSKVGLKPFCLELHSNKSGKGDVLKQFKDVLEVADTQSPQQWETIVARLQETRASLNSYVSALHEEYPNGLSAFSCISTLLNGNSKFSDILLNVDCTKQSKEQYQAAKNDITELSAVSKRTSREAMNAFSYIQNKNWSVLFQRSIQDIANELLTKINGVFTRANAVAISLCVPQRSISRNFTDKLTRLLRAVLSVQKLPSTLITDEFADNIGNLEAFIECGEALNASTAKLHSYNLNEISNLDIPSIEERIKQNNAKFFITRFFANKTLVKELSRIKKIGSIQLTLAEFVNTKSKFVEYIELQKRFNASLPLGRQLLGELLKDDMKDWSEIKSAMASAKEIHSLIQEISPRNESSHAKCLAAVGAMVADTNAYKASTEGENASPEPFFSQMDEFGAVLAQAEESMPGLERIDNIADIGNIMNNIIAHIDDMRTCMICNDMTRHLTDLGFGDFIDLLVNGRIQSNEATCSFEEIYANTMLAQICQNNHVLGIFDGQKQNSCIAEFCALDDKYIKLTQDCIFAKLAARLPRRRGSDCPENSELGILKRECEKHTRQMPIRQLLPKIQSLIPTLKPCFLMSPLSVAQYLPPDGDFFDLVVFDEASQIPVWDAIGVISRAKQLIVVGDPKQMPPTNFFQKNESQDDDSYSEETEDMESILDECLASGVYSSYLNWHYRSRHESLISFSNHHYYGDKLFTFPSASNASHLGVHFMYVKDATYDRKASRTNAKEADALIEHICKLIQAPETAQKSIGVVTFSEAQKNLIEDKLDAKRVTSPKLEEYIASQQAEPLFVKNLENVQGDERDIIIFSIGYANDANGKFSMNFGPLNRAGGERRLNVAITRAKEQVIVFSSIESSQIDLDRTQAVGAKHLKAFLEFAQFGIKSESSQSINKASADNLAKMVASFLNSKGYKTVLGVGCSGFKIDVAIVKPDSEDEYLAGIICDGNCYKEHRTARDRDHILCSVLKSLGWKICHAWSVDWLYNRKNAEAELLEEITRDDEKEPVIAAEDTHEGNNESPKEEQTPQVANQTPKHQPYQAWSATRQRSSEDFYQTRSLKTISGQIREIVQLEAPVKDYIIRKRIFKAWGISRNTPQAQQVFNNAIPYDIPTTPNQGAIVYWATPANQYKDYRIQPDNDDKRSFEDIPVEEIANAMDEVQNDLQTTNMDTIFKETLRSLGFTVLNSKNKPILDQANEFRSARS